MTNDVEHIFIGISISSLEKCLFKPFAHFWIGLFGYFCGWVVGVPYVFWILIPLSGIWIVNIFSHSVGCLFILLITSFDTKEILNFDAVQLIKFFLLLPVLLVSYPKKSLPNTMSWSFSSIFSSNDFVVWGLKFGILIFFSVNFCIWCKEAVQFHSYAHGCSVFMVPFVEETVFSPSYILASFVVD